MRTALTENEYYLFEIEIYKGNVFLHLSYKNWCKTAHRMFSKEFDDLVSKYTGSFFVYRTDRPSPKFLKRYKFIPVQTVSDGEIWERKL